MQPKGVRPGKARGIWARNLRSLESDDRQVPRRLRGRASDSKRPPNVTSRRRPFRRILLIATAIASGAWLWSALRLPSASRGLLFDELAAIPTNRVGLVLGCIPRMPDGRPNLYLTYRIEAAARLFHAGKVSYLLVSGDARHDGQDEVAAMREGLLALKVPGSRIVLDGRGLRTLDSVVRAATIYGLSGFTLVSQRFHNERAAYIARSFGLSVVGYNAIDPAPVSFDKMRYREPIARLLAVVETRTRWRVPHDTGERIRIGETEGG
jgi:SanA protein